MSDNARDLLNHLAVFRRSASREAADWVIERVMDLNQSLEELIGWGLLIPTYIDGRLESVAAHRLVRNFCREQHREEIWRDRLKDAASFYLVQTKLFRRSEEAADVMWDKLEAFELLLEAEELEDATMVLTDAHPLLVRSGLGRHAEDCYRRLLPKVTGHANAVLAHNYGTLLQERGELKLALSLFEKSLKIVEETNYVVGMATSLRQIGTVYQDLGEYDAALSYYERSLEVSEKLDDRVGIEKSLYQIGQLHYLRGNYDVALEQSKRTANVFGKLGDRAGVASARHQIGMILQDRGEYQAAMDYYRQGLEIKKKSGDRAGVAGTLHHIGMVFHLQGKYEKALEHYRQSLNIFEALQDRDGVSLSLHQIGMLYADRGEYEAALAWIPTAHN